MSGIGGLEIHLYNLKDICDICTIYDTSLNGTLEGITFLLKM